MLTPRRRSRHTFLKLAFLAVANAALIVFVVRTFSGPTDLRAAPWESILGLPNEAGDCLAQVYAGDFAGDEGEDALVVVRPACQPGALALSVYTLKDGQASPLWGSLGEPALVLNGGDVALAPDSKVTVRDADPGSALNRAGLEGGPVPDRHRVYQKGEEAMALTETWHDPVLVGQVQGTGGCLNVRMGPGTAQPAYACINDGEGMVLSEGPEARDGFTWWGRAGGGWVAGEFLKLSPGPNPDRIQEARAEAAP